VIGYLRGKILDVLDSQLLVGVGAAPSACVGYQVAVPMGNGFRPPFAMGSEIELFVHTHVREDALDLYGFPSPEEREVFLILLSVTGIGPKGALGILSAIRCGDLLRAILSGDRKALVGLPGIGKKTAERLLLELGDPLRKKVDAGRFRCLLEASPLRAPSGAPTAPDDGLVREAKDALMGLGYREQEIGALFDRVSAEGGLPERVEDLVRAALRQLG